LGAPKQLFTKNFYQLEIMKQKHKKQNMKQKNEGKKKELESLPPSSLELAS
jgi:hypothetical protein